MRQCNDMEWGEFWAEARGLWPRWNPTAEETRVWREMLGRFSHDVLRYAARACIESYASEHPKVAWLAKAAKDRVRDVAEPTINPKAGMTEVIDAPAVDVMVQDIREHGPQRVRVLRLYTVVQNPHLARPGDGADSPDPKRWPSWLLEKVWAKVRVATTGDVPMRLVAERGCGRERHLVDWVRDDPDGFFGTGGRRGTPGGCGEAMARMLTGVSR